MRCDTRTDGDIWRFAWRGGHQSIAQRASWNACFLQLDVIPSSTDVHLLDSPSATSNPRNSAFTIDHLQILQSLLVSGFTFILSFSDTFTFLRFVLQLDTQLTRLTRPLSRTDVGVLRVQSEMRSDLAIILAMRISETADSKKTNHSVETLSLCLKMIQLNCQNTTDLPVRGASKIKQVRNH